MLFTLCCNGILAQTPKVALTPAEQCIKITQRGTRCKLKVERNSKYCGLHNPKIKKCQANTRNGKKCSRNAERNSNYCWQHNK